MEGSDSEDEPNVTACGKFKLDLCASSPVCANCGFKRADHTKKKARRAVRRVRNAAKFVKVWTARCARPLLLRPPGRPTQVATVGRGGWRSNLDLTRRSIGSEWSDKPVVFVAVVLP